MAVAVIKTGGKQYLVKEKDKIKIEKLTADEGGQIKFDVLLWADGEKVEIGAPILDKKAIGKIIKQGRSKKVIGIKYKPKTREHKKFGHRQHYSEVVIDSIK